MTVANDECLNADPSILGGVPRPLPVDGVFRAAKQPFSDRVRSQGGLHDRPLGRTTMLKYAESRTDPSGMIMWWRNTLRRSRRCRQGVPRRLVARRGLELDPVRRRASRTRGSAGAAWPRGSSPVRWYAPTQPQSSRSLEPSMLGHDRQEAAAADRPARGRGRSVANGPSIPASAFASGGLDPAPRAPASSGSLHDRPAPDRRVERDRARGPRDGVHSERLQPDAGALEDDRFDPGRARHRPDGSRLGSADGRPSRAASTAFLAELFRLDPTFATDDRRRTPTTTAGRT